MDPFTPHPQDSGKQWASLWPAKWVILATAVLRDQAPPAADDRSLNNQAALLNSQEFKLAVRKRLERLTVDVHCSIEAFA